MTFTYVDPQTLTLTIPSLSELSTVNIWARGALQSDDEIVGVAECGVCRQDD